MGAAKISEAEVFGRVVTTVKKLLETTNRSIGFEIKPETNIYADLGIDSVEVMDLMGFIEKEFDISIDVEKAIGSKTIKDIVNLLISYLKT